jgi:PhzF family phenazine biosynthesis protein
MKLRLFQVDAFASRVFSGNPAAVCPLEDWLPDDLMQKIAEENNLSETAFFVRQDDGFRLRWFTPATEVDLCGHATLASAFVIWKFLGATGPLVFHTRSGRLSAERDGEDIVLDFPAKSLSPVESVPGALIGGLGTLPLTVLSNGEAVQSGFYVAVYPAEADVRGLAPDMNALSTLGRMGVVVTAPGDTSDFASRCFAPAAGIPEDPVTGSSHCFLVPYWAARLGKQRLHARQVSRRGGELRCSVAGDRVRIGGKAVCYMEGTIDQAQLKLDR